MFYDETYVLKTIEECDLNNRPNYKKLVKHLKENELLDKNEIDLDDEIAIKQAELNALKRNVQENLKNCDSLDVYDQFIDSVRSQIDSRSKNDDENVWNNINEEMDKELKSLEMVQLFMKRNKTNEIKKIEIDESALIKANDILKHFFDQK